VSVDICYSLPCRSGTLQLWCVGTESCSPVQHTVWAPEMYVTCCTAWPWRCKHYDPSQSQELRAHWHAVFTITTVRTSNCASLLDGSLNFDTLCYYGSTLRFCRNTRCHVIGASCTCCGHVWEFLLKTTELVRDFERVDKLHKCCNWRPNLPVMRYLTG
jgi:hypothetical protein